MNTPLATVEQPVRLPTIAAGAKVQPIVPGDFDSAYRIAKAVVVAGMAPKGLETAEKAFVAIMHGLEVGLPPMQALQSIAVINGRPSIWGDGAIGLVRGSGLCESIRERLEGDGDARVAICEVKRRGERDPIIGKFSVADAKRASLWTKAGPWKDYPQRMLQMRARAFALRDGFADVLRGLHIAEEMQDVPSGPKDAPALSPPSAPQAEAPIIVKESWQGRQPPVAEPPSNPDADYEAGIPEHMRSEHDMAAEAQEEPEESDTDWKDRMLGLLAGAQTMRAIDALYETSIAPRDPNEGADTFPGHWSDVTRAVEKARQRVGKAKS